MKVRIDFLTASFVDALTVSATSAVDLDTDRAIQDIMNGSEFSDVTVITIAYVLYLFYLCYCLCFVKLRFSHRLNTILKSDRIIVMDSGKESFFLKHYFHSFLFILVSF